MQYKERDRFTVELVEVQDPRFQEKHLLLVETEKKGSEFFHQDGTSRWASASIEVNARYFSGPLGPLGCFGELVCQMGGSTHGGDTVRITNGSVMIGVHKLQGLHIGSLVFGRVVDWAKQFPATWRIFRITLSARDARDESAKKRRNLFYERFGIRFAYMSVNGIDDAAGSSYPDLTVKDLIQRNHWDNISLLGHWRQALISTHNRFATSRKELRKAERLKRVYERQLRRREAMLDRVGNSINLVMIVAAALAGYAVRGWL
jgi:hypothetical protein